MALASGLLLAAGWPVYGIPILLFVAFVPLLIVERNIRLSHSRRKGLKVFRNAYLAFLVWNAITTWWIWYSTAFGMFFAILVNSLLMTVVFWGYHLLARKLPPRIHLVFLPALWISFEKFHLNWDFSWPWLNLGNAFSEHPAWVQWYEYTGIFGGSLWIWMVNIGLFAAIWSFRKTGNKKRLARGVGKNVLLIALPIIVSLFMYDSYKSSGKSVEAVVLQPNIDPYSEKYEIDNSAMATKLVKLASEYVDADTDYVLAPETALSAGADIDRFAHSLAARILQKLPRKYPGLKFITGADFYRQYRSVNKPTPTANSIRGGWFDAYNAAVQIDNTANMPVYIKSKLVVGVENLPFKEIIEPLLGNVMINLGGTVVSRATQVEPSVFKGGAGIVAPIICYESIYGEYVAGYVRKDADFLAVITNDGWWSNSQGHKQHLSYARLRAIETRRSVARSANTGISAFINPRGDVLQTLAYGEEGALKGELSLNEEKTFYVRYGDLIARVSVLLAGLLVLYGIGKKKRSSL